MKILHRVSLFLLAALLVACGDDKSAGPAGPYTLTITNNTELAILSVAISLNSDSDAGDNWLGEGETLAPGESRTFQIDAKGSYDIFAVNTEFSSYARIALKINSDLSWNITQSDCLLCD
jgi:hypothetical protein